MKTSRHVVRITVMQALFEANSRGVSDLDEVFVIYKRVAGEFAPGAEGDVFAEKLIKGVLSKLKDLDTIIERVAPEWPINRIASVDLALLRIALFELLFAKKLQVPGKVAINEAIEIAKSYGGESSGRFINGVLGTVYREIGEDPEMPTKKTVGAVAYAVKDGEIYFLMLHDVFGKWTLSRGSLKNEEDEKDGIRRVLKEEVGLTCDTLDKTGKNSFIAHHPEDGPIHKEANYYLARCPYQDLKLKKSGGLKDARWFSYEEAQEKVMYKDLRPIILESMRKVIDDQAKQALNTTKV